MCSQRFDSHAYTRLQFLRAVSDAVGSEKMLSESHSDADDDDDTEAPDDNTQHQSDDDTSDDAGTPTTVSADTAVDSCEVYLVAPRGTRIALVPCGHQRFCESYANEVHNQGRGCVSSLPHAYQRVAASVLIDLRVNLCFKITLRETATKI